MSKFKGLYGIRAVFGPHWNFNHVTYFVIGVSQNVQKHRMVMLGPVVLRILTSLS